MTDTPVNESPSSPWRLPVADVVSKYFGGDAVFFSEYEASCAEQLPIDLQAGQAASAASDTQTLMRTAHNLKSIFLMLGFTALSNEAAACETYSLGGQVQLARASWDRLEPLMAFVLASGALSKKA